MAKKKYSIFRGNVLIAKFLRGIKIGGRTGCLIPDPKKFETYCNDNGDRVKSTYLNYHKDWKWIMAAFDTIRNWPEKKGCMIVDRLEISKNSIFISIYCYGLTAPLNRTILHSCERSAGDCKTYMEVYWKTLVDFATSVREED